MIREALQHDGEVQEAVLEQDPRWLLVRRILASGGFHRATQLRKILSYVSRAAILQPDHVLREYDIACDVLERRPDFDPANDNIVRAQFTHLRRKLEHYFSNEGRDEPLRLTIPKGSYHPVFRSFAVANSSVAASDSNQVMHFASALEIPGVHSDLAQSRSPLWRKWPAAAVLLCLGGSIAVATLIVQAYYASRTKEIPAAFTNPFLQLLAKYGGNVSVVLPDTSEMIIQLISRKDISAADYANKDFSQKQIATVKDPAVREALLQLALKRNTTASEANVAFDFVDALNRNGAHGTVRYARDLHMRDLDEGSAILIGSRNSDPWVSRFTDRTNFRFVQDHQSSYFENIAPQPGELPRYDVTYADQSHDAVSYVDIAFMQNASQGGYILLIVGSDTESNEAASNFLLHGRLSPEIASLLKRKDLRSFELFLRGRHVTGEANDSLELIALRPR